MSTSDPASPDEVTATIELGVRGRRVSLQVTVPAGPTVPRQILPVAQAVADLTVRIATEDAEAAGEQVSCRAGCTACCHELIPVTQPEVHALAGLVAALPEPRRTAVRTRFADAARRVIEAGLFAGPPAGAPGAGRAALSEAYFALRLPCPFLDADTCSIYPDRPLVCREHLVTTPAERCWHPAAEGVRRLPFPIRSAFQAFAEAAAGRAAGEALPWVPLPFALHWAAAHPEPPGDRPGPDWLRELFARLAEPTDRPEPGGAHAG